MKKLLLLGFGLFLFTTVQAQQATQEILLAQEALVIEEEVEIAFTTVANDSRCPRQVQCIAAGEAAVILELVAGGNVWKETVVFPGNPFLSKTTEIYRSPTLIVSAIALTPYPENESIKALEVYELVLEIVYL